jgi:hypothetical protein
MADLSIYQNLLRPRSVADYQLDNAHVEGAQTQNMLGRLQLENAQRDQADDAAFRGAASNFGVDPMENYRQVLPKAPKQAAGYLKSSLDAQKEQSEIGKNTAQAGHFTAETQKINFDQSIARKQQHLAELATVSDAASMGQWLKAAVVSGELNLDKAGQVWTQIQQNPGSVEQWKALLRQGGMTLIQQEEEKRKQQQLALSGANELMTPDGKGGFVPNQPLIGAKQSISRAGASNVNVRVDNKLGESVAGQVGPMVEQSYQAANGAQQSIVNADNIIKAIDSGKVIAGPAATLRLKGAQIADTLGIGGKDNAEKIANTRQTIQGLAQSVITARGQLKGQGQVSDYEGKLLSRATSGEIDDLTAPEIKQLAQVQKRLSGQLIEQHKQLTAKLRAHGPTAPLADLFELNVGNNAPAPSGGGLGIDPSAIDAEIARRKRGK